MMIHLLVVCLVGYFVVWLFGLLVGCWFGYLVGWLVWLFGCLVGSFRTWVEEVAPVFLLC